MKDDRDRRDDDRDRRDEDRENAPNGDDRKGLIRPPLSAYVDFLLAQTDPIFSRSRPHVHRS
jgi:hypothetical protein